MSRPVYGIVVLALTTLPSVVSADPTRATASIRPKARGPAGLPLPPAEGDYVEWLHGQPQDVQLRINRYCSAHAYNYEAACGGIGPLHIPQPPPWDACEGGDPAAGGPVGIRAYPPRKEGEKPRTRWEWRKDMTKDQQHYTDQKCKFARRDTDLCGPAAKPHCNTPLVVSFDDRPVTFAPGARFSFAPGVATATDWPTADTPWIALDLDGDGAITSGAELFGDHTALPGGSTAKNGFEALAALDANHDGKIDAADLGFAKLVLWSGRAGDALTPLAKSIVSISLASRSDARCDTRGNCEGQRATITWRDAAGLHTGTVIDIFMPSR